MYAEIILQLIGEFQRDFPRKFQHPNGMLKVAKKKKAIHFLM